MYSALKACELQPVVQGAGYGLAAVHLGQGEDLAQVHAGVHAPGLQALAVGLRARRQGQELHQQALLAGALALHDELLRVFGKSRSPCAAACCAGGARRVRPGHRCTRDRPRP